MVVAMLASITFLSAYDFEVDGIYYSKVDDERVSVVSKDGGWSCKYSGDIVIPSSIECEGNKYIVSSIGGYAFVACHELTSISMPNSITRIGENAFYSCSGLTNLYIPNSVTHIGSYAFAFCKGLTSVVISQGVTNIEDHAFYDCCNLQSVVIPKSLRTIGNEAFSECVLLPSIDIPDGVTSIGEKAFSECSSLKTIFIPKTVEYIGDNAFHNKELEFIKVDESNPIYDSRDNCNALIKTASNTLIEASQNTFIPNTVSHIGKEAFRDYELTFIIIPSSVISIGYRAFAGCASLASVTLSEGLENIETEAFVFCKNLTSLIVPNSVTDIGSDAFYGCGLQTITLPKKMTNMGSEVFCNCFALKTVNLPDGIVKIGNGCFTECLNLVSVTIPKSVMEIGVAAFWGCPSLTSITIPKGVTRIDECAFWNDNLTDVTCLATIPPTLSTSYFGVFKPYGTLHVPSGCKEVYASAEGWKQFEIVEDAGEMDAGDRGEMVLSREIYTDEVVEGYTNCFIFSMQDSILSIGGYYAGNPNYTTKIAYTIIGHDIFLNMDSEKQILSESETQPLKLDLAIEGCTEDYYYIYLSGYQGKTAIVDDYTLHETSYKEYGVRAFVREKPPKTDISTGQKDPNEKSDVDVVCRVRGMVGGHYQQHVSSIEGNVIYIDGTYSSQAEGDEDVEATTPLGQLPAGDYTIVINVKDMDDVMPPFSATLTFKVTPTGVEVTSADGAGDVIFNLQGHRVSHATEGVYIKNGRKVLIR